MQIEGCIALVTGANRGLGLSFVEALVAAGAAKVYAAARDVSTISDTRATPIQLDITDSTQIAIAAANCNDVNLLINNAGVLLNSPMLAEGSAQAMRREFDVNVFGTLGMVCAFAPLLAANGGGAIVNMLSITSWITSPFIATYSASKHAELVVTDAARIQLRSQGTQVLGVYAGYIDTDMATHIGSPKISPMDVARRTLENIEAGIDHVLADDRAHDIWQTRCSDPGALEAAMQNNWDHNLR
jgi:NAD(P)-dependent dehydrogenase (short-subunit alcohol dehydrogenase family)